MSRLRRRQSMLIRTITLAGGPAKGRVGAAGTTAMRAPASSTASSFALRPLGGARMITRASTPSKVSVAMFGTRKARALRSSAPPRASSSQTRLEQCEWGRITQCPSGCVRGYRIRLFPDGGRSSDRTGAEGFSFKCTDGTTCSLENSNSQGEWSSWAYWVLISQSA